jgi:hypothetical protein
MKTIIVGPPFVGKSTLVQYLRQNHSDFIIKELDEMLIDANKGAWPTDESYRNNILLPSIIRQILLQDNLLFFTSYISPKHIKRAKISGYIIIQLYLNKEYLIKRNVLHDHSREVEMTKNLIYQNEIWDKKLIDHRVNVSLSIPEIAKQLIGLLE